MKQSELLIDQVYRSCFNKNRPRPELRAMLERARRFVLDDAMTSFLADLNYETFHGRFRKIKPHRIGRHFERTLDSVRYFSRLPHRVTWFEYRQDILVERLKEIARSEGVERRYVQGPIEPRPLTYDRRGWLCCQHDKVETAFSARLWGTVRGGGSGSTPIALVWATDDSPLPWRQWPMPGYIKELGLTNSQFCLMASGYRRDNVGFHNASGELDTPYRPDDAPELYEALDCIEGQMQAIWTFLSTLNKIPIIGERKSLLSHGFIARGRYRRFLEHSIITISIPGKTDPRKIAKRALNDLRRRAHQVRGHFRDDWRLPKGNKSLWIAEHQRGDASIGFVTHDYAVKRGDVHEKTS